MDGPSRFVYFDSLINVLIIFIKFRYWICFYV